MREAIILEPKDKDEEIRSAFNQLKRLGEEGEEGDIIFESEYGKYEMVVRLSQEFDLHTKKFAPLYWFNEILIRKLKLENYFFN